MHRLGRTFVRLSAENRLRIDRLRRHDALSRDRVVNTIVADYFDQIYHETRRERILRRRRAA
jgi:hypothetical protein